MHFCMFFALLDVEYFCYKVLGCAMADNFEDKIGSKKVEKAIPANEVAQQWRECEKDDWSVRTLTAKYLIDKMGKHDVDAALEASIADIEKSLVRHKRASEIELSAPDKPKAANLAALNKMCKDVQQVPAGDQAKVLAAVNKDLKSAGVALVVEGSTLTVSAKAKDYEG